jgi:hypothetical protein
MEELSARIRPSARSMMPFRGAKGDPWPHDVARQVLRRSHFLSFGFSGFGVGRPLAVIGFLGDAMGFGHRKTPGLVVGEQRPT